MLLFHALSNWVLLGWSHFFVVLRVVSCFSKPFTQCLSTYPAFAAWFSHPNLNESPAKPKAPRVAMMKELDIRGIALWNATPEQVKPIMQDILAGVAEGAIRPIIGREMPLADAAAAHVAVLQPGSYGKIVLVP